MKLAGLTGGIATGKSTVAKMFEELGAKIVDSDKIAKAVVEPGQAAYDDIIEHFGKNILAPDSSIDREKLGEIIFNDSAEREALNGMTHPRVFAEMQRQIKSYADAGENLVLCDIPLLIESGAQNWLKPIVLVYIPRALQIERLTIRDNFAMNRAETRVSSQMPIEEKRQFADFIVDNSGAVESTRNQVGKIFRKLLVG